MAKRYDLITGREGSDGKTHWTKIGSAWAKDDGDSFSLTFDALPIPDKGGAVRVLMKVPYDRDATAAGRASPDRAVKPPAIDIGDDETPF